MSIQELADDLVALCRAGKFDEAGEKYWADDVVSLEAAGDNAESRGKDAARAKGEWWSSVHEVRSSVVEGPYLHGDQFIVRFKMAMTVRESGQQIEMDETALYTVKDGKIVEERFFYGS